jgi:hypothetical protein
MAWVSGNLVFYNWQYLTAAGVPKTGMVETTDIEFTLKRNPGTGLVAAAEDVTFTETGATGYYTISFTPASTGLYSLWIKEINADSMLRQVQVDFSVVSAGSAFSPNFSNAFCAETDMERWLQQAITATTSPSSTEAAGFAETRAAELMAICYRLGKSVTPTTVTAGSRLEDLLRRANGLGAALDYTVAQSFKGGTKETERIPRFLGLWRGMVGDETKERKNAQSFGTIGLEVGNLVSLSTDHIISGDTQAASTPSTAPYNESIQIGMGDDF